MKNVITLMAIFLIVLLAACGKEEYAVPELLEVDLRLPEDKLDPGAEVILEAYVWQGDEAVEDANEVKFEIQLQGVPDSEILEGQHQGKGIYTAEKQFMEEGIYSITAHVTARDMHNMPKKDLVIGTPSEPTDGEHTEHESEDGHTEHDDHGDDAQNGEHAGHSHDGDVIVDLQSGYEIKVNENTELAVFVEEKGEPVTGAALTFEIWAEGQEEHDILESAEEGKGVYKANRKFETAGMYKILVYVKKGDLEEEQLFTVLATE
jgi:hypothetical protein